MLFQPTNVSPSLWGELGSGTVDATQDLTVSWQVNGNSPMTAFVITIYTNNAASTQKYTTGNRTDNCPFYGTDYQGNTQLFSYTIPAATLSTAGITNGNDYKLIITQYWSANDSVTQTSASAFITRSAPTLTIDTLPSPFAYREYNFTATYSQADGDALNWVRWQLAYGDDTENIIKDTGNIYGTAQLQFDFDGFFAGTNYAIRCTAQTQSGETADSGWQTFTAAYSISPLIGYVDTQPCKQLSGILVSWQRIMTILGVASGDYSISGGSLKLASGNYVNWDTVNNAAMSLPYPWTVIWRGQMASSAYVNVVGLTAGNTTVYIRTTTTYRTVIRNGTTDLFSSSIVPPGHDVLVILTPTNVYIQQVKETGGLYPASTLYPGATLYPKASTGVNIVVDSHTFAQPLSTSPISNVRITGQSRTDYLWIGGALSQAQINNILSMEMYTPMFDDNTVFFANFDSEMGINAGNLAMFNGDILGYTVYRQEADNPLLTHIADVDYDTRQIIDCGAKSQTEYTYQMLGRGEDTYITQPVLSNPTTPVFWDWTVLECTQDDTGRYEPLAVHFFGKNLVSGAISNNNSPGVEPNFTPYPYIQKATANYKSGTLTSLIGTIDYTKGVTYSDTIAQRDAIYNLSLSTNTLFLKSRKGDLMRIAISGPVMMTTHDNTREQAQEVTLPWAEIGPADDVVIRMEPDSELWPSGLTG